MICYLILWGYSGIQFIVLQHTIGPSSVFLVLIQVLGWLVPWRRAAASLAGQPTSWFILVISSLSLRIPVLGLLCFTSSFPEARLNDFKPYPTQRQCPHIDSSASYHYRLRTHAYNKLRILLFIHFCLSNQTWPDTRSQCTYEINLF